MGRKAAALVVLAVLAAPGTGAAEPLDAVWADIVAARVSAEGEVAYRTLAAKDKSRLVQYLESLADVDTRALSRDEAVALWINAFNAMAIAAVVQGGTPETPEGRARMFHWTQWKIGRAGRTLDEVEAILSRYADDDPRIHLTLCNAARGGPKLWAEAYVAGRLDAMLAAAARRFVNDPVRNRFDAKRRVAVVSAVFDWYRGDFERAGGSVASYVAALVADPSDAGMLSGGVPEIRFSPFDWTLNAQPGERPG